MLDGIIYLWGVLTLLSLIFVVYDLKFVTPTPVIMKAGWFLVVLYTGPIGLFIYILTCREPLENTHEEFIKPLWKQSVGSLIHCLAGDATGIILSAVILSFIGISKSLEMTIEYIAGFSFGLLIFQSLFMKSMTEGNYFKAIQKTFYPEFLSMNLIMGGMIPVMEIWSLINPVQTPLRFYAMMSLATIIGALASFPINRWLVKNGLKHGMLTIREGTIHMHMEEDKNEVSKSKYWSMLSLSIVCLAIGISIAIIAYKYRLMIHGI